MLDRHTAHLNCRVDAGLKQRTVEMLSSGCGLLMWMTCDVQVSGADSSLGTAMEAISEFALQQIG